MADARRPATELERRLRDALHAGDQEGYFRLLADAELVVPVPSDMIDDVLANQVQPTWPTREEDGRIHVLAFTSPGAMRESLGPAYQHFMKLKFGDIAEGWPDSRWWLLIDAAGPTEARLPAWFVRQVAEGDTRPPSAGPLLHTPALPPTPAQRALGSAPGPDDAQVAAPAQGTESAQRTAAARGTESAQVADAIDETDAAAAATAPAADETSVDLPAIAGAEAESGAAATDVPVPRPGAPEDPAGRGPATDVQPTGSADRPAASPEAAAEHAEAAEPEGPAEPAAAPEPAAAAAEGTDYVPANDVERDLQRAAAQGDQDAFVRTLVDAEVLLPIRDDMDYSLRPGRSGFPWQTSEINGATMIPVFTSVERLREGAGAAEFLQIPFVSVIRYWPDRRWALAVNSGTPGGASLHGEQLAAIAEWADRLVSQRLTEHFEPQNEVEQRLHDAATRRDTDAFFKVLLSAQVLVPADPDSPWGIKPDDPDFPWRAVPVHGKISIQIFTSLKWMHEVMGSSRFVMPSFLDMALAWPDPEWTLVLNPGTPIDSTLPGDQVGGLTGAHQEPRRQRPARSQSPEPGPAPEPPAGTPGAPLETHPEPPAAAERAPAEEPNAAEEAGAAAEPADPDFEPRVRTRPASSAAPARRDEPAGEPPAPAAAEQPAFKPGNRIDQELFEAATAGDSDGFLRVLLSANVLVPIAPDAPLELTPVQPEFRWDAALRDAASIQVFTSLVRLREVMPGARFVYAEFRELIGSWPHAATDAGEAVRPARLGQPYDWSMLLNPGTRIGASLRGDQVHALSEWAVRVGLVPSRQDTGDRPQPEAGGEAGFAAGPAPEAAGPRTEASPSQPTVMQKVLPHEHVSWYLEQGYDRVGGFVHPVGDVNDLQTPLQLYEALGLLYADSPFATSDESVYVIRWPAYCPALYRIPFGGQTEDQLHEWGEAGWVVERAPFMGNGFAPGSAGSIREYKLDSARLPYGAELYILGSDRSERFVAMYDPDRAAWLRAEAGDRAEVSP